MTTTCAPSRLGEPLTARELAVVARVAAGDDNAEAGAALSLSPLTVKSHLARITRKVGTGDRAGIVGACHATGQIVPDAVAGTPPVPSSRQVQILALIAKGLTNQEIAGRLNLSESTVKTHLHRLLPALGARNRAHAVHLALSWRLIAPRPRATTT